MGNSSSTGNNENEIRTAEIIELDTLLDSPCLKLHTCSCVDCMNEAQLDEAYKNVRTSCNTLPFSLQGACEYGAEKLYADGLGGDIIIDPANTCRELNVRVTCGSARRSSPGDCINCIEINFAGDCTEKQINQFCSSNVDSPCIKLGNEDNCMTIEQLNEEYQKVEQDCIDHWAKEPAEACTVGAQLLYTKIGGQID